MDSSTVLAEPEAKPHVKRQISWMTSHDSPALRWPENTQHFECTYGAWETEVPVKKRQYMYPYSTPKTGLAGKPSIPLESPLSPTPHLTLQHPYPTPTLAMCWAPLKLNDTPPPLVLPWIPILSVLWQLTTDIAHSWCFEPLSQDSLLLKAPSPHSTVHHLSPARMFGPACLLDQQPNHRVNRSDLQEVLSKIARASPRLGST